MKIFADRLRELRLEKGLSCRTLGKAIEISHATINRWEKNQLDIKAEHLIRLANYFETTPNYLLGFED